MPKQIFIFSGHRIDEKGRKNPRFPSFLSKRVKKEIKDTLQYLNAGDTDLALTQGACGGDILFTEACLELGVKVEWIQAFPEHEFLKKSVYPCGNWWVQRYQRCKRELSAPIYTLKKALNNKFNPYSLTNRALLENASIYGIEKVKCICLWDGREAEKAGGTGEMVKYATLTGLPVIWIDIRKIFVKGV